MTKGKYPYPKTWLSTEICALTYRVYQRTIKDGEPLPPFEERYAGRLESILGAVRNRSESLSYDLLETCVAYYVSFAKSHPFLNGNKRMSIVLADMFLIWNGYELSSPYQGFHDLTLAVSRDTQTTIDAAIQIVMPIFKNLVAVDPTKNN